MFSAEHHIQTIHNLEHGKARLDALNAAITEADAESAHNWRIYFRYEYIEESIFHDDSYKAVIRFPEMLAVFDEHPELEDDYYDDILQAYKWVLENMQDYYQISREEIEKYYGDYERRCRKYGYSLRVAHLKKSSFYKHVDRALAIQEFEAYQRTPRDATSDCKACETSQEMKFQLYLGNEEEALHIAQPLFNGELRCGEVPHVTYGGLTSYYLYKGNLKEAAYYGARCERMIGNEPEFLNYLAILMELYSCINPAHGWRLFKQSIENFLNCHNPVNRMYYAGGAYRLLSVIVDLAEGPDDRYSRSQLLRLLPVPEEEKGISLEKVRDYFYGIALEQAGLLDKRNGTSYFTDRLQKSLPKPDQMEKTESSEVLHGLIQKRPTMLAVSLPEGSQPTMENLAQRLREAVPEGLELVSAVAEDDLRIMVRREGILYEIAVFRAEVQEPLRARPVAGLRMETFELMQNNPCKYLFTMELGDAPLPDYAMMMQVMAVLFPEMLCMADLLTQHAYPASWVRYAAQYPDTVTPSDLFGLYLSGSDETGEVWITTIGMCTMGMRELEIVGADHKNYDLFADMLDQIAQQCVERGILPDAGAPMANARLEEGGYQFTWAKPEDYAAEGTVAAEMERDVPSGVVLVLTDDGAKLPPASGLFEEEPSYPSSNREFYRRLRLAKAAFPVFRSALEKPFAWAAARVEFELDEETADKFGFGIELLWAEVSRVENGKVYAALAEESEALPDLPEGSEVELTADNVVAWRVQPQGWEAAVTETNAHRLEEVEA
ncbi:MAG: hypothetical protein IKN55_09735 [Oscillospiraceae bacterium]|nr:hypothetical protein [Oscillospiraceae bacterium]